MTWKRSITVIVSAVVLAAGVKLVLACGPEPEPYDGAVNFFPSNINAQPQYQPFYYTDLESSEDEKLADGNTGEWYTYANKEVKRNDIDSFMNKYSYQQVRALADKKSNVPATLKNNTFARYLLLPKNKESLDYILYAKKCEPLNAPLDGYWDNASNSYKTPVRDTAPRRKLIAEGVAMNGKTKNDFLKWRYAYQALRLAMYGEDYGTTLDLYEKMIGKRTADNLMYPRCLGLKAGALYHTKKKKMAAYLYSQVFDLSNDMKRSSFLSFTWATDGIKSKDLLAMCKTPHEKATLMIMDGLYEHQEEGFEGLSLMQGAYALDPNVKGLDIIMTREMNKAEQHYMLERQHMEGNLIAGYYSYLSEEEVTKMKTEWKKTKTKYKTYLNNLNTFAQKMAADKKTKDKAYWQLASAYICFIEDKFTDSRKYLALSEKNKMNNHEHDVHDIINMLCIVHNSDKITPETEGQLLPNLQWVEKRANKNERFAKVYRDMLSVILTDRYMQQKDTVKALYCQARITRDAEGDFVVAEDYTDVPGSLIENMSIDKMHEVEAFVQKSNKTAYETWLTDKTPYPASALKEVEGTKYIRELNFEKAAAVLAGVPKSELSQTVLPDFMLSHLEDTQDWDDVDSAKTYTKLEFAQKMAAFQKTLEKQPNNSRIAYQYANGLYGMSYYGKAHHATDYYRGSSDNDAYFCYPDRKKMSFAKREYYGLYKAQKYYLIAANNMSDPEMKARCLFLAAMCWQKNCSVENVKDRYSVDEKAYYQNSLNNPHFEKFNNSYKMTKVYREIYSSCSYLRDYAKRNR